MATRLSTAATAGLIALVATTALAQDYPGREQLRGQSAEFRREVIQVASGVYVAVGYAASNVVLIQGADSSVIVDTAKMPANIQKIAFTCTIHDAAARNQNFGQIQNAYIRLYDDANGQVVAEYDLDEMFSQETSVQFGSFFRATSDWAFKAVGAGYKLSLEDFVEGYR